MWKAHSKASGNIFLTRLMEKGLEKMTKKIDEQYENMKPVLFSKKNEFHLYGYTTVTEKEIWDYCVQKLWRNKDIESMRIYQIVNDILKVLPAAFMTFTQIEEQRETDWFSELNSDELQILLSPKK